MTQETTKPIDFKLLAQQIITAHDITQDVDDIMQDLLYTLKREGGGERGRYTRFYAYKILSHIATTGEIPIVDTDYMCVRSTEKNLLHTSTTGQFTVEK